MSPGDVVKVRLQCQTESRRAKADGPKPKYRGPAHCLLSIIKEDGVAGLYRGALPLMLRDGPSYALYFLTYSTASEYLTDSGKSKPSESSPATQFASCHVQNVPASLRGQAKIFFILYFSMLSTGIV